MLIKKFNSFQNKQLQDDWTNLYAHQNSNANFFNSLNWCQKWSSIFSKSNILIIAIYDKDNPILILPLFRESIYGINILRGFGSFMADYGPIIINTNYQNKELSNTISKTLLELEFDYFEFNNIDKNLLKLFNFSKNIFKNDQSINSYQLNIQEDLILKKKIHKEHLDINRQIRRLNKIGKLSFGIIDSKEEKIKMLIKMIQLKSEQYRRTQKRDIFKNNLISEFFKDIFLSLDSNDFCHISYIKLISLAVNIISKNKFYYLMPSYDYKYSKYSPGKILLKYLIDWSKKNQLETFDFTVGDEPYKSIWTNQKTPLYKIYFFHNLKGYLIHLMFLLRKILSKNKFIYFIYRNIKK